MATLDQIYSYDQALETAWMNILQDAFDTEFATPPQVAIEQSDALKVTPFVDVQLRDVSAFNQTHLSNGVTFYNAWEAHLVSRVTTQRGKNSDQQSLIIGKIRAQAANWRELLTRDNLPYHCLLEMKDAGLHRGLILDQMLDWSEVIHLVKFGIRDDVWPF